MRVNASGPAHPVTRGGPRGPALAVGSVTTAPLASTGVPGAILRTETHSYQFYTHTTLPSPPLSLSPLLRSPLLPGRAPAPAERSPSRPARRASVAPWSALATFQIQARHQAAGILRD